ncbi:MAG: Trp family transcriptional regulator, partial [Patescibacteria group bacterium]
MAEKVAKTKSKNEVKRILENLISEDEKKMMLRRLAILALVQAGKSYQEIGEILWVSPQTISTVKKNSLGLMSNYKSYRNFYGGPT